jgi:hypothetical protein
MHPPEGLVQHGLESLAPYGLEYSPWKKQLQLDLSYAFEPKQNYLGRGWADSDGNFFHGTSVTNPLLCPLSHSIHPQHVILAHVCIHSACAMHVTFHIHFSIDRPGKPRMFASLKLI